MNAQDAQSQRQVLDRSRLSQSIDALSVLLSFDGLTGWLRVAAGGSPGQFMVALSKAMPSRPRVVTTTI